jgi:flagellar motor switch protein FliN/FliY
MSSSSSSDASPATPGPVEPRFASMRDVRIGISVMLGTGTISVRACLGLAPRTVLRLNQAAGEDVQVLAGRVPIARAEVVIVEDSTAVRVTDILRSETADPR